MVKDTKPFTLATAKNTLATINFFYTSQFNGLHLNISRSGQDIVMEASIFDTDTSQLPKLDRLMTDISDRFTEKGFHLKPEIPTEAPVINDTTDFEVAEELVPLITKQAKHVIYRSLISKPGKTVEDTYRALLEICKHIGGKIVETKLGAQILPESRGTAL